MNMAITNTPNFTLQEPEYKFIPLEDVYKQASEVEWLIEDYIPKNSIGMLYGPSGVGKTHIVLHMAAYIASGLPWCKKDTDQGLVLVMAGEGQGGLKRRLQSIEKRHNFTIDRGNLFFSERAVSIDSDKGLNEIIKAIEALEQHPSLIIIDTLSRHLMQSSENNNEEMARVINRLEHIKMRYGCTIMIIHHTGKNAKSGARGASSIRANIDFSYALTQFDFAGNKVTDLKCEKQKDASDDVDEIGFVIVQVELDENDSKGHKIQGACVHPCKLESGDEDDLYESIAIDSFNSDKANWQKEFLKMVDEEMDVDLQPDSLKKRFRETVKKLVDDGKVKQIDKKTFELAPQEDDEEG